MRQTDIIGVLWRVKDKDCMTDRNENSSFEQKRKCKESLELKLIKSSVPQLGPKWGYPIWFEDYKQFQ